MSIEPQWWGYSKEHGWVVLDRELPCNFPGHSPNLLFLRCRDGKAFVLKRELWRDPAYRFAPNYVRERTGPAAEEAQRELDEMMRRWPEFQAELKREYKATVEQDVEAQERERKKKTKAAAEEKKAREAMKEFSGTDAEDD